MNIGIVCYPTYGGSGVVATELGKALAQRGHKVHFITYDQPTRLDLYGPNIQFHKVNVANYPLFKYPPYELALASKIVMVAKEQKLDVLHAHYAVPHASAAYMAKKILKREGIEFPIVTTLHGTDITLVGKDDVYAPVVAFSIEKSDAVTSVSESLRQDTYEVFDIQKEIDVIPNFIDLNRFKKQNKEHFKRAICPNGEKVLLHASNFRKVKRVEDVMKIFCQLRQRMAVKLLLVGDGPERAQIEKICRNEQIEQDIHFLGEISAVEEVLSVADLFVMPSEKESFGLAALEAMACEVPVLSSNAGGLPELNVQGETGYMADVGDVEKMAEQAYEILKDENLSHFKLQALRRAQDFEIERIVPRYEAVYRRVCALVHPEKC